MRRKMTEVSDVELMECIKALDNMPIASTKFFDPISGEFFSDKRMIVSKKRKAARELFDALKKA